MEEKKEKEEKPVVYATGGGIAIPSFDRKCIVLCHSVKYAPELLVVKGQPKYVLYGIDRVGFWGEHLNTLGWYATQDDVKKEMEAITEAIKNGQASYELQYNAEVEIKGFLGQVWLKE